MRMLLTNNVFAQFDLLYDQQISLPQYKTNVTVQQNGMKLHKFMFRIVYIGSAQAGDNAETVIGDSHLFHHVQAVTFAWHIGYSFYTCSPWPDLTLSLNIV